MTREQQRQAKEARKAAKIALKIEKKQANQEARAWQKMVIRFKALGAWIEGNDIEVNQFSN